MIELRWNGGVLEQRIRRPMVRPNGHYWFDAWSRWHPVPNVPNPDVEPFLPSGITYGKQGPGGEFYTKLWRNDGHSIWTKGDESWTSSELRAIADHQDWLNSKSETIEPIVGANIPDPFRSDL